MGAESSSYQDIELEEKYELSMKNVVIYPAKAKDGSKVSVFVYEKSGHLRTEHVDNAAKQLKRLRHPSILKFLTLTKHSGENWLITEQVKPLETVLDSLNSFEICAGLYNIIEALAFLHDRGGVCHNNISPHSIYVSENGNWKLGGMEYLCKFGEATKDFLNKSKDTRDPNSISPEEKDGKVNTSEEFDHARDAYSFGVLAEQLLECMSDLGDMVKTFELRIQDEFLNPDPKQRPKFSTLLDDRLFKNDFLDIINFLNQVTLKSEAEKKEFFSTLVPRLYQLPEMIIAQRLVHPLLSRFVLLDETADKYLIPHLLQPGIDKERPEKFVDGELNPVLSEVLYRRFIIPELYRIFHVRDAHIRLILLEHFKHYVNLFDHKTLRSIILPQVLLGLLDTNDLIVELTLRALAEIMPILGGDIVIGKSREKIFAEGKPRLASDSPFRPDSSLKEMNNSSKTLSTTRTTKSTPKTATLQSSSTEKVTLKDLAKQSEREKRREEAKRRSEERRKKREEAKKSPKKATLVAAVDEGSAEETTDADNNWSGWEENEEKMIENTHTNTIEINEDKWSDIDENDIEDDIENELNTMDSTLSTDDRIKIETNDKRIDNSNQKSDPIKVDWSGIDANKSTYSEQSSSHRHKKGALQLSVQKSKSSPPPESHLKSFDTSHKSGSHEQKEVKRQSVTQDDFESDWGQGWSADVEEPENTTKNTQTNPIDKKPLGAEFDVLSIEVKQKKNDDFDFFADMTPVIKTPNLMDTLSKTQNKDIGSDAKDTASVNKPTLSFAMADVEEVTSGWGDDDEDFDLETE